MEKKKVKYQENCSVVAYIKKFISKDLLTLEKNR